MTARRSLAFLTGRGDRRCCALSPAQAQFLSRLSGSGDEVVDRNFPYVDTPPYREVPLALGSCGNIREYFFSRRPAFAQAYGANVTALIERTEHAVFLAGSCGLELFNNLHLSADHERRCTVICLGPVARALPRHASTVILQGRRDFISRVLFRPARRAVTHRVACNHLGYLHDREVLRLCQNLLQPLRTCSNISG